MFIHLCLVLAVFCVSLNKDILISAESDVCSQPLKAGNCRAFLIRYGFQKSEGRCVQFVFGGCQENENNFHTLKECLQACKRTCTQPLISGSCRAAIPRFGFDSEQGKCVEFTYGGCDMNTNNNNFETLAECQSQCEAPAGLYTK